MGKHFLNGGNKAYTTTAIWSIYDVEHTTTDLISSNSVTWGRAFRLLKTNGANRLKTAAPKEMPQIALKIVNGSNRFSLLHERRPTYKFKIWAVCHYHPFLFLEQPSLALAWVERDITTIWMSWNDKEERRMGERGVENGKEEVRPSCPAAPPFFLLFFTSFAEEVGGPVDQVE